VDEPTRFGRTSKPEKSNFSELRRS
jgi:hypothetical protein